MEGTDDKRLFDMLKEEPGINLPMSFAATTARRAARERAARLAKRAYLQAAVLVIGVLGLVLMALFFFKGEVSGQLFVMAGRMKYALGAVTMVLVAVHLLDQKLLARRNT